MKAIEILDCILYMGLSGEDLQKIEVPSVDDEYTPQNEGWWLNEVGACPPHPIAAGIYILFYSCYDKFRDTNKEYTEDAEIADDDGCSIYLYKLED